MSSMTILGAINEHPMAATMVIVALLLVKQIIGAWRGKTNASTTEHELLKLAKQISQTVNECSTRSHAIMDMVDRNDKSNDVGLIHASLKKTVQLLEKVDASQSLSKMSLDGISRVSDSIADDLRRGDHRVVHTGIINQIGDVKRIVEDTKQLTVHIAEKI